MTSQKHRSDNILSLLAIRKNNCKGMAMTHKTLHDLAALTLPLFLHPTILGLHDSLFLSSNPSSSIIPQGLCASYSLSHNSGLHTFPMLVFSYHYIIISETLPCHYLQRNLWPLYISASFSLSYASVTYSFLFTCVVAICHSPHTHTHMYYTKAKTQLDCCLQTTIRYLEHLTPSRSSSTSQPLISSFLINRFNWA